MALRRYTGRGRRGRKLAAARRTTQKRYTFWNPLTFWDGVLKATRKRRKR